MHMATSDELRDQANEAEQNGADKAEDLRRAAEAQEESERNQENAESHDDNA